MIGSSDTEPYSPIKSYDDPTWIDINLNGETENYIPSSKLIRRKLSQTKSQVLGFTDKETDYLKTPKNNIQNNISNGPKKLVRRRSKSDNKYDNISPNRNRIPIIELSQSTPITNNSEKSITRNCGYTNEDISNINDVTSVMHLMGFSTAITKQKNDIHNQESAISAVAVIPSTEQISENLPTTAISINKILKETNPIEINQQEKNYHRSREMPNKTKPGEIIQQKRNYRRAGETPTEIESMQNNYIKKIIKPRSCTTIGLPNDTTFSRFTMGAQIDTRTNNTIPITKNKSTLINNTTTSTTTTTIAKTINIHNYFTEKQIVKQILIYLFGKIPSKYTKIANLINLTTFALCNKYIYDIVSNYIKKLALYYENNLVLFENKCFDIFDSQDGIKILMAIYLVDNTNYMYLLEQKFQYMLEKYLNNNFIDHDFSNDIIQTLNIISKIFIFRKLFNSVTTYLYNIIFDDFFLWNKKHRAIDILTKLEQGTYYNNKSQIVIEFINIILIQKNHAIDIYTICEISKIMDQCIDMDIMKKFLCILNTLINDSSHNGENILTQILLATGNILPMCISMNICTDDILFNILKLLNHEQWGIVNQSLSLINNFIKMVSISKINIKFTNELVFKLKEILVKICAISTKNKWKLICNVLIIINYFAKNRLLSEINIINDIFIIVKGFLYEKRNPIIGYALELIGNFAICGVMEKTNINMIEEIMIEIIVIIRIEIISNPNKWQLLYNIINVVNNFCKANILKKIDIKIIEEFLINIKDLLYKNKPHITKSVLIILNNFIVSDLMMKINTNIITESLINYLADKIIFQNKWELISETIILFSNLSKTGMLNRIDIKIIENILIASKELLNKKEIHIINNTLSMIGNFTNYTSINKININIIEEILIMTNKLLHIDGHYFSNNIILTVGKITECGLINNIEKNIIKKFLSKVRKLLNSNSPLELLYNTNNGNIIIATMFTIGHLADKNMLENIDNEIIEEILIRINELLDGIEEHDICYIICTIGKLAIANKLNGFKDDLMTIIYPHIELLLDSKDPIIIDQILITIHKLTIAGMINMIEVGLIDIILKKIILLFDRVAKDLVCNIILVISAFAESYVLYLVDTDIITQILIKIEKYWSDCNRDSNEWKIIASSLFVIRIFIEKNLFRFDIDPDLKKIGSKMIEKIINDIEILLCHNNEEVIGHSLFAIGYLIELCISNKIKSIASIFSSEVISRIIINTENLLNHNNDEIIVSALFVIGHFAKSGVLKNNLSDNTIKKILFRSKELLSDKSTSVLIIYHTKYAIDQIIKANVIDKKSNNELKIISKII